MTENELPKEWIYKYELRDHMNGKGEIYTLTYYKTLPIAYDNKENAEKFMNYMNEKAREFMKKVNGEKNSKHETSNVHN